MCIVQCSSALCSVFLHIFKDLLHFEISVCELLVFFTVGDDDKLFFKKGLLVCAVLACYLLLCLVNICHSYSEPTD